METQVPTTEQILTHIKNARDSVWVIDTETLNENVTKEIVERVQRNVAHLEIITSSEHVIESGEDISDLLAAITKGNDFIQEHLELLTP